MQEKTTQGSRLFVIATLVFFAHGALFAVLLIPLANQHRNRAPARPLEITRLFLPTPVSKVILPRETNTTQETEKSAPPLRPIPKTPLPRPILIPRIPPRNSPPLATLSPAPAQTDPCAPIKTGQEPRAAPCPDTARRLILPGGLGLDDQGRITGPGIMANPTTPEGLAEEKRLAARTLDKLSSLYGNPVFETPQRYESDRIAIQGTTPFQTLRGRIDRLFSPPVQKTP